MKSHCSKNLRRKTKQEKFDDSKGMRYEVVDSTSTFHYISTKTSCYPILHSGCTYVSLYLSKASVLYMAVVKHKEIKLYEWIKITGQGAGWFRGKSVSNFRK